MRRGGVVGDQQQLERAAVLADDAVGTRDPAGLRQQRFRAREIEGHRTHRWIEGPDPVRQVLRRGRFLTLRQYRGERNFVERGGERSRTRESASTACERLSSTPS